MPENDRDVFQQLQAAPGTPIELDLLTYAIYAAERYAWIDHRETGLGRPTTQAEIDAWISEIPPYRFLQLRNQAEEMFARAARQYLEDEVQARIAGAIETSIVSQVRTAGSFWRQVGIALITAILAPLIIGAVIARALPYDRLPPDRDRHWSDRRSARAGASASGLSCDPSPCRP